MSLSTKLAFISAVNDDQVLKSCLLQSPDLARFHGEVLFQKGYADATKAFNAALSTVTADVAVFLHQDLYLPDQWLSDLDSALVWLAANNPDWGVLGLFGVSRCREMRGWVYSTGLKTVLGSHFSFPEQVRTLDEVLLVIRKSSGLRFDENLHGFHMYGTDICIEAESLGLTNYVIPAFAVHNSNGIKKLPRAFWDACRYVRRKRKTDLPIHSPCVSLTSFNFSALLQMCRNHIRFVLKKHSPGVRHSEPATIYRQLLENGVIARSEQTSLKQIV
jgi:hypothetical protein